MVVVNADSEFEFALRDNKKNIDISPEYDSNNIEKLYEIKN
jgi:hypothetical protein